MRTPGQRIAHRLSPKLPWTINQKHLVSSIDRAIRRAQADAWDQGFTECRKNGREGWGTPRNPYRSPVQIRPDEEDRR